MIADKVIPVVCLRRGERKAVYRIRQEVLDKWILSKERQGIPPAEQNIQREHLNQSNRAWQG
jgi:hypothetical protein